MMPNLSSAMTTVEYALPLFEENMSLYVCGCASCLYSSRRRRILRVLFFCGFLVPICWFMNFTLFLYAQYYLKHTVHFPTISEDEFPTAYELEFYKRKTVVSLKNKTQRPGSEANQSFLSIPTASSNSLPDLETTDTWCESSASHATSPRTFDTSIAACCPNMLRIDNPPYALESSHPSSTTDPSYYHHVPRLDFLNKISVEIIASHGSVRKEYRIWMGRTAMSVLAYAVILMILILAIGQNSSSSNLFASEERRGSYA